MLALATVTHAQTIELPFSFDPASVTYEPRDTDCELPRMTDCELPQNSPGKPWLPVRYINVLLPDGARATRLRIAVQDKLIRNDILICPEQAPQPLSLPAPDSTTPPSEEVYNQSTPYPETRAVLLDNLTMRGKNFVSIQINPLQYIPAKHELYLCTNMTLIVFYTMPTDANLRTASAPPSQNSFFASLLNELVINPTPVTRKQTMQTDDAPIATCDYLIITSSALSNSFQNLATFRASHNNINTRVITVEHIDATYPGTTPAGSTDTQTKIRNCISNYVDTLGTTYVVLGGDSAIVPDRNCKVSCGSYLENNMPTDLYYSGLDGSWDANANGTYGETSDSVDMAYDVIVGRIPIRTATQADDYINKLIRFETSTVDRAFSSKILLLGDKLWSTYTDTSRPSDQCSDGLSQFNAHSPVSDAEIWIRRLFRDEISAWTNQTQSMFFDTQTSWDTSTAGDYIQSSTTVQNRFNEGWNHVYFGTHGGSTIWGLESGSYGTSRAASLTNLTALVYTMACLTGRFDDVDPCLSEAFIRNGNGGGALAYLGCSRYGWGSPGSYSGGTSMSYAYQFYKQIFSTLRTNIGVAFAEHKLAKVSSCSFNGSYRWVQFGLNLQGDPLIPIHRADMIPGTDPFWFSAFASTNETILRWPNPVSCGMQNSRVHIEYDPDNYPATPTAGFPVYEGTEQEYTHTGLTPGERLYYTIWVTDDGSTWTPPPID